MTGSRSGKRGSPPPHPLSSSKSVQAHARRNGCIRDHVAARPSGAARDELTPDPLAKARRVQAMKRQYFVVATAHWHTLYAQQMHVTRAIAHPVRRSLSDYPHRIVVRCRGQRLEPAAIEGIQPWQIDDESFEISWDASRRSNQRSQGRRSSSKLETVA